MVGRMFTGALKMLLVLGLVGTFALTASAEGYFPLQDKNQWILKRDGRLLVYTVSQNPSETYTLKIENKSDGRTVDHLIEYTVSKVQNGVKLHKTVIDHSSLGVGTTDFSGTPFLLYEWDVGPDTPPRKIAGETWLTVGEVGRLYLTISVDEVERKVQTPIREFVDCVKIKFDWILINSGRSIIWTEYEWLAPDFGIVKYQFNEYVYVLSGVFGPVGDKLRNGTGSGNGQKRDLRMLTIVSGDLQEGGPQTALGNPLVVLVRDQYGNALSGVDVTFRVTRGGGSLSRPTARTDRTGRAETTLTLASEPGIHQVEASVVGFPSLTQTFTAAGAAVCEVPPPSVPLLPRPTRLSIVSGNNQPGEIGEPLAQPFIVGVLDQYGKPLEGIVVAFATLGGGQISGHRIHTDVYGQAQTTLTLGSLAGRNSVTARAAGITRTFTATATAPPPPKEPEPVVPVRSSTEEPPMYWIAGNTIYHRSTGGGNEPFHAPQSGTFLTGGLAVDMGGRKVYWTERTIDNMGRIQSADLDGNSVETVQKIIAVPYDIAFDAKKRKLYWTNSVGKIQSIKVGSSRVENFRENLKDPKHIAFDVEKRRLHWTAADGIWSIYTDNDTGMPRRLDKGDLDKVRGIAVFDDVVYWTEQTNGLGRVRFMNRMGSGDNKLLAVLESESIPGGIAVDPVGGRVYWTTSRGEIRSAPRVIQTVVMGGDEPAIGIALGGTARESASPGAPSLSSVGSVENTLLANYPNPFNPETWIPYQLSASADVSVSIYAVDGHLVRRLDLGHQSAGVYRSRSRAAYWDGRNEFGERVASGLYFYTLTAGDFTATRKMLIRK